MNNKYFYIGKEQILKNESMVYGVFDFRVENYKDIFGENCVEFVGENLPYYMEVCSDGTVRESTTVELYKKGVYNLSENQFIKDDIIYSMDEFPLPEGMAKPVFNKEVLKWEETATAEEIAEYMFRQSVSFYNSELEFASKATAELACEIITQDAYADVKAYMKAIDPYAQPNVSVFALKINRPSIFDRYN